MARREFVKRFLRSRLGPTPQSIAGATMGLVAIAHPWLAFEIPKWWSPPASSHYVWVMAEEYSLLEVISGNVLDLGLCCAVFLFGTVLSLFTPAGSIAQVVGLMGFAFGFGALGLQIDAVGTWSLGLGYALGIVSTLVVVDSTLRAVATANNGKPVRMLGRFAALSPRTISSWR